MERRRFLHAAAGALLVLPVGGFLVQGCYGAGATDNEDPAAPPATSGSNAIYTSSNDDAHFHTFAIALAAFDAPAAMQGQTSLDDGHLHSVAVAVADLQNVKLGQAVKVTTGNSESHTHVLTLVKVA